MLLALLNLQMGDERPRTESWLAGRSWDRRAAQPVFSTATHGLMLGLGGGVIGSLVIDRLPLASVEAAELNPVIAENVPHYLGFPVDGPRASVAVAEGAAYVGVLAARSVQRDWILVDICTPSSADGCGAYHVPHAGCCPPASMLTAAFFRDAKAILRRTSGQSGVFAMHVWAQPAIRLHHVHIELRRHFHHVRKVPDASGVFDPDHTDASSFVFLCWDGPAFTTAAIIDSLSTLQVLGDQDLAKLRRAAQPSTALTS